jgi:hypothetical protein
MRRCLTLAFVLLMPALSLAAETPVVTPDKPAVTTSITPATPAVTPAKPVVKPTSSLDTNGDGKVDATETATATNTGAAVGDVLKDGADVVNAAKGVKDSGLPKSLAVAVLLGAVFKLLLSLIKVLGNNVAWFKSQDGKRVLKYSTLGLGAAAALAANLGFGMNWIDAITILLSGPLAVAIHEYTSDSKPVAAVVPVVPPPVDPPKA